MSDWIPSKEMADNLGIHRASLNRLKNSGFLKEKQHFIKKIPTSPRSDLLWHRTRTLIKMGRI
tara:strand:+ start:61 stop:249 length:189 start_codon:yes stop_codon:yes gene_type:complete